LGVRKAERKEKAHWEKKKTEGKEEFYHRISETSFSSRAERGGYGLGQVLGRGQRFQRGADSGLWGLEGNGNLSAGGGGAFNRERYLAHRKN